MRHFGVISAWPAIRATTSSTATFRRRYRSYRLDRESSRRVRMRARPPLSLPLFLSPSPPLASLPLPSLRILLFYRRFLFVAAHVDTAASVVSVTVERTLREHT